MHAARQRVQVSLAEKRSKIMAEGSSPAAKRVKVDGCKSEITDGVRKKEENGENEKIAFVTGITGQVKTPRGTPRRWTRSLVRILRAKQRERNEEKEGAREAPPLIINRTTPISSLFHRTAPIYQSCCWRKDTLYVCIPLLS